MVAGGGILFNSALPTVVSIQYLLKVDAAGALLEI